MILVQLTPRPPRGGFGVWPGRKPGQAGWPIHGSAPLPTPALRSQPTSKGRSQSGSWASAKMSWNVRMSCAQHGDGEVSRLGSKDPWRGRACNAPTRTGKDKHTCMASNSLQQSDSTDPPTVRPLYPLPAWPAAPAGNRRPSSQSHTAGPSPAACGATRHGIKQQGLSTAHGIVMPGLSAVNTLRSDGSASEHAPALHIMAAMPWRWNEAAGNRRAPAPTCHAATPPAHAPCATAMAPHRQPPPRLLPAAAPPPLPAVVPLGCCGGWRLRTLAGRRAGRAAGRTLPVHLPQLLLRCPPAAPAPAHTTPGRQAQPPAAVEPAAAGPPTSAAGARSAQAAAACAAWRPSGWLHERACAGAGWEFA